MTRYEQRLRALAKKAGLCVWHCTRLVCACDFAWTGTPAALDELITLKRRSDPYYQPLRPHGHCLRCQGSKYCFVCYGDAPAPPTGPVPEDLDTAEESARYAALLSMIQPRSLERSVLSNHAPAIDQYFR
jgi:hypothetical protein